MKVKIKITDERAHIPTYGTDFSAGADLYNLDGVDVTIAPHTTVMVKLGFQIEIPDGYAGLIFARSGLASKRGIAPANKVGVIDSDYRGEIGVGLINTSDKDFKIVRGDRIAQLMFIPVLSARLLEVDELDATERGAGGFGSTGIS
jgi:dUTP pyrophosphatase